MPIRKISAVKESFVFRVLLSLAAVIVAMLVVFTAVSMVREGSRVRKQLQDNGEMLANLLAYGSVVGVFAENPAMLEESSQGIAKLSDVVGIVIYAPDGRVLYRSKPAGGDAQTARPGDVSDGLRNGRGSFTRESRETIEVVRPVLLRSSAPRDESLYFSDVPDSESGAFKVIGYVQIALSKQAYYREIGSVISRNGAIMILFIIAGMVLVYLTINRVTRPLARLTDKVRSLEKGFSPELFDPAQVETTDEIGKLATAFNAMVRARVTAEESLRDSEERYRRLVELSPDAVLVLQDGKIAFSNASGAALLGSSGTRDITGKAFCDYLPAEDREFVEKQVLREGGEYAVGRLLPMRFSRSDGSHPDAEVSIAPFTFAGRDAILLIARDVSERKGMEEKIRTYQAELRSAQSEMLALESRIEERERHLIATDLHDFVGQNLVVSNFKLGALRRCVQTPDAVKHLDDLRDILGQTIQYTRSLTAELSSPVLGELGLRAAVDALAESFQKTHGILVSVRDDGGVAEIANETRYLLFRNIRELLMNVVKHARATNVTITLGESSDAVSIAVSDNGVGFDAGEAEVRHRGFGLYTIRERMKRLGGHCEIISGAAVGTTVTLVAPFGRGI